jgi:LmbE family N-acetylglucosaminyl deacetylase
LLRFLRHKEGRFRALRYLLFLFALPLVYFGGASAAYYYRHRAAARLSTSLRLPVAFTLDSATRLMVFAPHCDDEALGCAGLIAQTLKQGGAVQAGILTSGDGFATAVERQVRDLRVKPKDYLQFALLRQEESRAALAHLGLPRTHVAFYGFPDRGLMALWNAHWTPDRLYTSPTTQSTHVPYTDACVPNAPYCGQSLLAAIKAQMKSFRPTLITVTHPADDHPDHAAAAAFVTRALQELQAEPQEQIWAGKARLRYYLIHRGDWPPSAQVKTELNPPKEMARLDTLWETLPLSSEEAAKKRESLTRYSSQMAMMQPFLTSFARGNELFGEIPPTVLPRIPDHAMQFDASLKEWQSVPPALLSPVRDNVIRELQGGGDMRALYACRDRDHLYLRLDMREAVSRRIRIVLHLRAFGPRNETSPSAFTLTLRPRDCVLRPDGVRSAVQNRQVQIVLPWKVLSPSLPHTLALSIETSLSGLEIDQTGICFLSLEER